MDDTVVVAGGTMCPNCLLNNNNEEEEGKYYERGEVLRLEAIKEQILTKLGLSARPNVSGALPRDIVLQTLSRAHEGPPLKPPPKEAQDEFYSSTSEIITFAEPGTLFTHSIYLGLRRPGVTTNEAPSYVFIFLSE